MSSSHDSHYWQFEELMQLAEGGGQGEAEELFEKLLRLRHDLSDSLLNFVIEHPNEPRLAVLLELLAKMGNARAIHVLIRFLDIEVVELRRQAVIGLGWMRARAALERIDQLEGSDPEESVRHEARVAVEEILRDFPNLRGRLRHHEALEVERRVEHDTEGEIAGTVQPPDDMRRRLAGLFPRLLARRYHVVPLWLGPGGVIIFAMHEEAQDGDPLADLRRLTGREVEIHAWPRRKVAEWMLEFYDWGDDDWLLDDAETTQEALDEICAMVLEGLYPDQPHPALPDCTDATEAAQSLLSLLAQEDVTSAVITRDGRTGECRAALGTADGGKLEIDPPSAWQSAAFHRALLLLAGMAGPNAIAKTRGGASKTLEHGTIRDPKALGSRPFAADVSYREAGTSQIITLQVNRADEN